MSQLEFMPSEGAGAGNEEKCADKPEEHMQNGYHFFIDPCEGPMPYIHSVEEPTVVESRDGDERQNGSMGLLQDDSKSRQEKQIERPKKACILSIDGGGMRGIIPAKVLCYVEGSLKKKSGNPDARIADYFDLVAGTSVGGLIATMLCADAGKGRPLFSAMEGLQLLEKKGKRIFKIPLLKRPVAKLRGILTPRYSVKNMEAILREHLVSEDGHELTLKDALKPLLIPCYDLLRASTYVFTRAYALASDSCNYRLIDICRATSAVPGFFRPATISSVDGKTNIVGIDGGLVMNNPTAAAVAHALHNDVDFPYVHSVEDVLVLSLGTGLFDCSYNADKVRRWGAFQWAKPIAKIVLDGISDMVDHSMSMAFSSHRANYIRIQVSKIPSRCLTEMDNSSTSNVRRLTKIADDMLNQPGLEHVPFGGKQQLEISNQKRLDAFVDLLIAERKSRVSSVTD
ncbi:hypothetical protein GOP47_0007239 [Adiantum capillus-veneris]|uniref:Patatin n=1 Tax=Adiantum capillus-veneris TaxID=13818 RepID=A0A9D4V0B0_ADICA|nr:hypothetical protein GOP47_0007239 [Adiantum capillus-veneris]